MVWWCREVGKDGTITVSDGKTMEHELEVVEGMQMDRGCPSGSFQACEGHGIGADVGLSRDFGLISRLREALKRYISPYFITNVKAWAV